MTLVIGALVASMFLTLVAFLLAGRSVTINNKVETTLANSRRITEAIADCPDIISNEQFRNVLFDSSFMSDNTVLLVDEQAQIIQRPPVENTSVSESELTIAMRYIGQSLPEFDYDKNNISYVLIPSDKSYTQLLITMSNISGTDLPLYITTVSSI